MRHCDLTFSYTESSGGIRRYIDQKRNYLLENTDHEHIIIVPGEKDAIEKSGRLTTYRIASPVIPGCAPYRFFWRPSKIKEILNISQVNIIELASFYMCPWAAFSYRKTQIQRGKNCLIAGYIHTDIADAYVGAPLRNVLAEGLGSRSRIFKRLGLRIAGAAETGVEEYIASILKRCDLVIAAAHAQANRVREYGINHVEIVPLGVDLNQFHPRRRNLTLRADLGINTTDPIFIYAGRLDSEKHVRTLIEAHAQLAEKINAHLVLVGNGPLLDELTYLSRREPRLHILPFQRDIALFSGLLASADVYVTAGPHETFGLSVIEAQASGLPVVGVNAGALRERVVDGLGFLAPVDNTAVMSDLMLRAYNERLQLGANARRHVEKHFSWEATFSTLFELYESKYYKSKKCVLA